MSLARIDHLVIVADSLGEGAAWCEAALGVTPGPGGEHPFMGTHNRLVRIATVDHPRAYLEIIAIDPGADASQRRPGARWFDMDDPLLARDIRANGPRLVHFVASVPAISQALHQLHGLGIDRGEAIRASRMSPRGLLEWQISVRPDGRRLFDGCLPTLIEWGAAHPAAAMPTCGVSLQSMAVAHPHAHELQAAYSAIGLGGVSISEGAPHLCATLLTPRGRVVLDSKGL